MLELFQTEWCPASRRVRQRLTELGLDYVNRQVPVEREARTALREATGTNTIPALRLENGSAVVGEENIVVYLSEHFVEALEAEAHQRKAAKARRRYLEEECQCSQPATHSARRRRSRSTRPSSESARS
jgi:glutathione S-transferase